MREWGDRYCRVEDLDVEPPPEVEGDATDPLIERVSNPQPALEGVPACLDPEAFCPRLIPCPVRQDYDRRMEAGKPREVEWLLSRCPERVVKMEGWETVG